MFWLQRHQDFAVPGRKRDVVAVGEVGRRRDADVVYDHVQVGRIDGAADLVLNPGKDHAGILNARSHRRIHVQTDLSGIHYREEFPADERHRADRADHQHDKQGKHRDAVVETPA